MSPRSITASERSFSEASVEVHPTRILSDQKNRWRGTILPGCALGLQHERIRNTAATCSGTRHSVGATATADFSEGNPKILMWKPRTFTKQGRSSLRPPCVSACNSDRTNWPRRFPTAVRFRR